MQLHTTPAHWRLYEPDANKAISLDDFLKVASNELDLARDVLSVFGPESRAFAGCGATSLSLICPSDMVVVTFGDECDAFSRCFPPSKRSRVRAFAPVISVGSTVGDGIVWANPGLAAFPLIGKLETDEKLKATKCVCVVNGWGWAP
jgi:hypothetical protein